MTSTLPPLTAAELSDLKAKAKAATPGPWSHYRNKLRPNLGGIINEVQCDEETPVVRWNGFDDSDRKEHHHARNAAHIAAANPETILRLIDMIERGDEQVHKLRVALTRIARNDGLGLSDGIHMKAVSFHNDVEIAREALAATEPQT